MDLNQRLSIYEHVHRVLWGCSDVGGKLPGDFVLTLLGLPAKGHREALYEFVASRRAKHFGILVPEPVAVGISRGFGLLLANSKPHLAATFQTSVGLNFGTRVINPMTGWLIGRTIPETT